jgi:hypothetical protein
VGAVHDNEIDVAVFPVTDSALAGPGTPTGVMESLAGEKVPIPSAFTAAIRKTYGSPGIKPETVACVAEDESSVKVVQSVPEFAEY